jgi:Tetrapyrrole (Corrin/Porphyrin) Methylases
MNSTDTSTHTHERTRLSISDDGVRELPRPVLTVVGTGIKLVSQLTVEAREAIRDADVLLHATQTPGMGEWLAGLNPNAIDLTQYYQPGRDRWVTYQMMADRVLAELDAGRRVCAAFYGHPAVYVTPSHEIIRRARQSGHVSEMLPGISAEDCLFADLGVDPGRHGWQSYDATPFLVYGPVIDTSAALVLWQLDALGHRDYQPRHEKSNYDILSRVLGERYGSDHVVIGYHGAQYPDVEPQVAELKIGDLAEHDGMSTLYIPPSTRREADRDMLRELGLLAS